MKKIKLKHGEIVLVDNQDYEELNKYKWCLNGAGYATRQIDKGTSMLMHRFINDTPDGMETDHINRNKLDNRRKNLRTVTTSKNHMNIGIPNNNTSGVKGVTWDKVNKKWQAQLKLNGKNCFLGRFTDIEDAKNARLEGEIILWMN